ncbi:MAG: hypothetical protein IT270_02085 [Saprospiraceae bacterium]|nr:hypothetical protein [Saprospiraceae bacterium]
MRYVFHLFLILAFFSCKKDDDHTQNPGEPSPPPADVYIYVPCDTSTGVARGSKLGNDWISGAELSNYEVNDTLYWYLDFLTCTSDGLLREYLSLGGFPDSHPLGTYSIVDKNVPSGYHGIYGFSSYGMLGDDGDLLLDFYKPDTTATINSYLQITRWDTIAHIVEGNFHLAYRATHVPTSDPKHYEFMEFSDGRFWAKIPE